MTTSPPFSPMDSPVIEPKSARASFYWRPQIFVGAILVVLVFSLLWVRSRAIDIDSHNRYANAVVTLNQVDAQLNQAVLQVRYGLLNNYDPLVQGLATQRQLENQLLQPPIFIRESDRQELVQLVEQHGQTLAEKADLIERFKSDNAVLRNSLAYFPIAVTDWMAAAQRPTLLPALNTLMRDVLVYNLSASETLHEPITRQVAALRQAQSDLSETERADLAVVLTHADIILAQKPEVFQLVEAILAVPLDQRVEDISAAYNRAYQAALRRASGYRFWLYLLSVVLVVAIATLIIRQLRQAAAALRQEQSRAEALLLNILPAPIARRLKQNQQSIAESFPEVTVMFADIVGFTEMANRLPPKALVSLLNTVFSAFDRLTERYGLEKIKTIGDAYMVVGGLPSPHPDAAAAIAQMALDMQAEIARFNRDHNEAFSIRIGINTGPVVAGVIGLKRFIYDLWGNTVNVASRMESQGIANSIQVTEATYQRICDRFIFQERGIISVKGKGDMTTYLLLDATAQSQTQTQSSREAV